MSNITRIIIDTEFTNMEEPSLISIGLVREDGASCFYAEVTDGWGVSRCSTFVMDEVIPSLNGKDSLEIDGVRLRATRFTVAKALTSWLAGQGEKVVLCMDGPEFDWPLIIGLLHGQWPKNVLRDYLRIVIPDDDEARDAAEDLYLINGYAKHHALYDAEVLRLVAGMGYIALQ